MTRARELARLANENVLSVEDDSLEVGIKSTKPTSAMDVGYMVLPMDHVIKEIMLLLGLQHLIEDSRRI